MGVGMIANMDATEVISRKDIVAKATSPKSLFGRCRAQFQAAGIDSSIAVISGATTNGSSATTTSVAKATTGM
jgi:hypothetical protein